MGSDSVMQRTAKLARLGAIALFWLAIPSPAETWRFSRDVAPILAEHCYGCHGPDEAGRKADLQLDTFEGATALRDGIAAIVPGKPDQSEMMHRVLSANPDEVMPPPNALKPMSDREKKVLSEWIAEGAVWGAHWAYEPVVRPQPPISKEEWKDWIKNPIDAFIAQRLDDKKLAPSSEAPPATLARRLSLDLIGLPPTPTEVDDFVRAYHRDPDLAVSKWVDHLLASPHYGERWATPWLDAARYADSHGYQKDDLVDLWPYRDWVVSALNADMPFDQFTIEQLAGDLLPNPTPSQLIATGFHRCVPCNVEAGTDQEENRTNQVMDRVNTTGLVWLATSLECAQCHDHKYDPISQREYFQIYAFFNNTTQETRFTTKQKTTLGFTGPYVGLEGKPTDAEPTRQPVQLDKNNQGSVNRLAPDPQPRSLIMMELPQPRESFVFQRGSFLARGIDVSPGTPEVLPAMPKDASPDRLGLAKWLVSRDNPLTARVVVNRFWVSFFGRGIVATAEDFGSKGDWPSHPELLDWLAAEFMQPRESSARGWSMKHLHRLMVTSATYRQSSTTSPALLEADPLNIFLARAPRLRLDAEAIRDNALAIGGTLNRSLGGPPIFPPQPPGLWDKVGGLTYEYIASEVPERYRRGLYIIRRRSSMYPSLSTFDGPDRTTCAVKRSASNTALQALTLLNDPVFVEIAEQLGQRLQSAEAGETDEARLRFGFRLAVGRTPGERELAVLIRLLQEQRRQRESEPDQQTAAWRDVASALLNLDETITRN